MIRGVLRFEVVYKWMLSGPHDVDENVDYYSETNRWKPVSLDMKVTRNPTTLFFIDGVRRLDLKTVSVARW